MKRRGWLALAGLAAAGKAGALRITASAAGVELLHRHLSWIVPVLELALVYAWLLLGQMPSPAELTGGALMLTGVILIRADDTRRSALT